MADKRKTLASRRGSLGVRWSSRLAALVPRPTVPPGAGNEAKKAVKPESKRVEKGAQGYVERSRFDGHLDAAAVGRHDDGDMAAVLTIQIEQCGLRRRFSAAVRPRCSGSLAGIIHASTAPDGTAAALWRRIPAAITMTTPTAMSASPMLKTLANGSHEGSANRSVSGSSAGSATIAEFV